MDKKDKFDTLIEYFHHDLYTSSTYEKYDPVYLCSILGKKLCDLDKVVKSLITADKNKFEKIINLEISVKDIEEKLSESDNENKSKHTFGKDQDEISTELTTLSDDIRLLNIKQTENDKKFNTMEHEILELKKIISEQNESIKKLTNHVLELELINKDTIKKIDDLAKNIYVEVEEPGA